MIITRTFDTFESLPDILTAKHILEYLGLSKASVYDLCRLKLGGIPCYRFGRSVRVEKTDFKNWLDSKKKGTKK